MILCSVESLREFVAQLVAGEIEPYIKSEPLPDDNSGPVTVSHTHQLIWERLPWKLLTGGGRQEF